MNELEVGQVLSMIMRFNNAGDIASSKHPYLIVDICENWIEVAQIDSIKKNAFKAMRQSNKVILADNPTETVIDRDSYVQLDNTMRIELCDQLIEYRRQRDLLSEDKLNSVLNAYNEYHRKHVIDTNKCVYIDEEELVSLNEQ